MFTLGNIQVFHLDPQLEIDTIYVTELSLCQIRLVNDRRYPWLILIPKQNGLIEIHDLSKDDQSRLILEITTFTRVIEELFQPEKINVGSLGNVVSQLHIHVIGRFKDDYTWPGPVWGDGKPHHYTNNKAEELIKLITKTAARKVY